MNKIKFISIFTLIALISGFGITYAATAPSLSNEAANVTGTHNAVLSVFVNPNGSSTNLHFKYWTGSIFRERLYMGVNGTSSVRIELGLINLLENSDYSYQIVAENAGGTTSTGVGNFNTSNTGNSTGSTTNSTNSNNTSNNTSNNSTSNYQGAPSVITNGTTSVSANSAIVTGSINPNGLSTKFWFEFGTTQALGQTTSAVLLGNGSSSQSVTGNLSGLQLGKTYYYQAVAQNSSGTVTGMIRSFTTSTSSTSGTSGSQSSGQVLGSTTGTTSTSGSTGSTSTSGSISGTSSGTTVNRTATASKPKVNSRPSFISLEYSLNDNGALVHVVNDIQPKPGEEFSYTIVYKNDTASTFKDATLKVIIPSEAYFISSSMRTTKTSSNIVEINLGDIEPGSKESVTVIVVIKDDTAPETKLIFTSVLGYKDRIGTQLATTSYMTVIVGDSDGDSSLSASFLGAIFGSTGMIIWGAFGLIVLLGVLAYALVRIKRNGKNGKNRKNGQKEDEFGLPIPATFEPIGPFESARK